MGSDQGPDQGQAGGSVGRDHGQHLDGTDLDGTDLDGTDLDGTDLVACLLRAGPNASERVRDVVAGVVGLCDEAVVGDLVNGPSLADSVIVLAQATHVLQSQLARRVTAAAAAGVLRHTPRVTLTAEGGLAAQPAGQLITAGAFADQHPELAQMWRDGETNLEAVAAIARGLRPLPVAEQDEVVAALVPVLRGLSVRQVRKVVARAVDLLTPDDRNRTEQRHHDRRFLAFCDYGGMTMIRGELPGIDGAAVTSAIRALADSLRAEGDGLTRGQRYADALITLVNAAAAHGDLPATGNGLPVSAAITVSLTEAERLTTGVAPGQSELRVGTAAGIAHVPESDTTLGDAAARFVLCNADLTGVIISNANRPTHGTNAHTMTPLAAALAATRLEPLAVGRATRLATKAQRTALAIRDRGCVIPGCDRPPAECQVHHVTDWAAGGRTDCDTLALLCWTHHRQVDLNRWRLVRNPHPDGPYWTVTAVRRHAWRDRRAA